MKNSMVRAGVVVTMLALIFFFAIFIVAPQLTQAAAPRDTFTIYFPYVTKSPPVVPSSDEAAARISVPSGFAIRIFASNLSNPRLMTFGPDGILYVALMGAGQIARLPDRDANGLADGIEVIASGLNAPHGVEWNAGWLYVAEQDRIERFRDAANDGTFESREIVTTNIPCCGGHSSRTLHFGPDGKLYVSAGSSSNIAPENDPRRAAILRFNPDGTIPADNPFASDPDSRKQAVWAEGLRNSVDFVFTASGELWADHNGSDGLGDDVPPEEIVINVQRGRSHGWPYCYTPTLGANLPPTQTAETRDTRVALPPGFDCAQAVPALFTDLAHSAPLGMSLVSGANFPAAYRSDLFVAYHGSWNTNVVANYRDCKVQRVIVQNNLPTSSETFATGWRAPGAKCGDASTWGRPADVIFGPDGVMYISDDRGGRIYRVVYVGQ
ncbi:MAG: PQQ-dependent sugar dehydrogenase [Anaerolineales bacterium]|nr:PQQ-dependent sugar dehydrogenase [Anaerolineales bacterium]